MSYVFTRWEAEVSLRYEYSPSFCLSLKRKIWIVFYMHQQRSKSPWVKHMKVKVTTFVCFSSLRNTVTIFWKLNTTKLYWSLIYSIMNFKKVFMIWKWLLSQATIKLDIVSEAQGRWFTFTHMYLKGFNFKDFQYYDKILVLWLIMHSCWTQT